MSIFIDGFLEKNHFVQEIEKLNKSKENVKLFLIQFYIPLKLIDLRFTCLELF